jgi:catechol 2,3-dioxygenase-like lactoylglutathione lyase family enzyme
MMAARMIAVVVNCRDAEALAGFWAAVLGREAAVRRWDDAYGRTYVERDGAGEEPVLLFQPVEETGPAGNRLHLDVAPPSGIAQQAEVARLVGLGAAVIGDDPALPWVVMADPEGNEFCVLPPRAVS